MSHNFNLVRKELEWGGKTLTLETGKVARQADGAVIAKYGETTVLCTAVGAKKANPDTDFFPLTVHLQEKFYAVGRIPGGYVKREGKPSEFEVLTSRLIDRPIRPLFPEGFFNEVQVICTVLTHDQENSPDIVAMIGASAALAISGMPFMGPIAATRVAFKEGEYILNPTASELEESNLDLVVAGTESGVLMVESEAKELTEEVMLGAVNFGHEAMQPVIGMINELKQEAGKPEWQLEDNSALKEEIAEQVKASCQDDFLKAYKVQEKQERSNLLGGIRSRVEEELAVKYPDNGVLVSSCIKKVEADVLRSDILKKGERIDGRDLKTVRTITAEAGVLPRVHGSSLFTRGETQALVVTTLGTGQDEQIVDALFGEYRERFMLHYNFPPYSVGEAGRFGPPGRREIGHGKLAWRAIAPLLPTKTNFPYTMRVVSEITESNGSSSMATVCGTSLSLMDAGVPMPRPVAGIAMGLVKEGDDFAVLSDILGDEDHLGDMDFKVAGTDSGITALQMDIKITSITPEIMKVALEQAKDGRLHILGEMSKAISTPRAQLSDHAPIMESIVIKQDKIRDLIGPGGKTIREICEVSGAKIDIGEDGTVMIAGIGNESVTKAKEMIQEIAGDPEIGRIYTGKVVKIMDFGAFVNFMGNRDGLVHISELAQERVDSVGDVVSVGQEVHVKVLGVERGKVKLSMKSVNQDSDVA